MSSPAPTVTLNKSKEWWARYATDKNFYLDRFYGNTPGKNLPIANIDYSPLASINVGKRENATRYSIFNSAC